MWCNKVLSSTDFSLWGSIRRSRPAMRSRSARWLKCSLAQTFSLRGFAAGIHAIGRWPNAARSSPLPRFDGNPQTEVCATGARATSGTDFFTLSKGKGSLWGSIGRARPAMRSRSARWLKCSLAETLILRSFAAGIQAIGRWPNAAPSSPLPKTDGNPQTEVCATGARATSGTDFSLCGLRSSLPGLRTTLALAFARSLALLLFTALPACATTYYVAAAGSDSNNGTATGTPWAHAPGMPGCANNCAGVTLQPGDSVLFNRGDAWYGQTLTVTSSGASGSPITIGAYGSGANPILKGSTLLSTSGYTLAPNQVVTILSLSDSSTSSTDSATRNWRMQIDHTTISNSAVAVAITVKASATQALNITGSAIGPANTAPNTSSMTRITWNSGSNGATVSAGTSLTSDTITYSLNNSVDQIVSIYTTARNVEYFTRTGNDALWTGFNAVDESQNTSVSSYSTGGNSVIGSIAGTIQTVFTYRNTLGVTPVAAWENGSLLKLETSQATVEANAGSWYYDGTYLYLHASDGSNVATNGKTYTYVTASSPSYTTWDNAKSWLIFDSLDQAETYNTSGATLGGMYLTGSHSIVRNLATHDHYRHPLTIYVGATNNTVTNVTSYNSYGTAPLAIFGAGTSNNLVQNSTFYNDTSQSSAYVGIGAWAVVILHGGSTSNTVDNCLIYSTAASAAGYGVMGGDNGTTGTISHSKIYGTFAYGVNSGSGGGAGLGTGSTLTLWGNLIDISAANNAGMLFTGSTGNIVYNNTIYGPSNTNAAISEASTSTGGLIKNNIFWTGAYITVDATSETSAAIDYNDYYSAAGTPFSWGGTAYTFANWKTNSSQDAHSINSNPTLVGAAPLSSSGNYTLVPGSPAIDSGVNLGSTYQNALAPSSTWPSGISFVNQNTAGTGWEIGAYAYLGWSTLLLRGCCD